MADAQNVNWGLTALAGVLTVGRYAIRLTISRKLYWDDAVHGLAFAALLIHGATNQVTGNAKDQLQHDSAQGSHVSTQQLLAEYHHLYQLNTVNNVFLYGTFWIVKFAFLLCYRQLFKSSKRFNQVWWAVTIFTFITYWVPFGGVIATCYGADTLPEYKECNSANPARAAKLIYTCVLNVVTDVMIMALPLWMLPRLKISLQQKIGLAFIFSIALFCVALDILRTAEALNSNQALYTVLEINFVVIVSCLPTYRSLLTIKRRERERKASQGYGSWSRSRARKQSTTLVDSNEVPMKNVSQTESSSVGDEEAGEHPRMHLADNRAELPAHDHAHEVAHEPVDFTTVVYR